MNETGPKFNHQECFYCAASPHCGANRLADEFIKLTLEPELDEIRFCLNALTSELFLSIVDRDSVQFRSFFETYHEVLASAYDGYSTRIDSIDQLIDDSITAHRLSQDFSSLIDLDEEIVNARDRFIETARIASSKAPSFDRIKSLGKDVVDFQGDGECYQFSPRA